MRTSASSARWMSKGAGLQSCSEPWTCSRRQRCRRVSSWWPRSAPGWATCRRVLWMPTTAMAPPTSRSVHAAVHLMYPHAVGPADVTTSSKHAACLQDVLCCCFAWIGPTPQTTPGFAAVSCVMKEEFSNHSFVHRLFVHHSFFECVPFLCTS